MYAAPVVEVFKGADVIFTGHYGLADVAASRPMGAETMVRNGSITKLMTAWP